MQKNFDELFIALGGEKLFEQSFEETKKNHIELIKNLLEVLPYSAKENFDNLLKGISYSVSKTIFQNGFNIGIRITSQAFYDKND